MTKALKLFILRDAEGKAVKGEDGKVLTFTAKPYAKHCRNVHYDRKVTVSPGPDHRDYRED